MIFSEVYSTYYNAVGKLIDRAIDGELDEQTAISLINETAFSESFLYILSAIKQEEWKLITESFQTPIKNKTSMPITLLQKRFLKAISLDKRFRLFADPIEGLEDIEPLYFPEDFYYFDRVKDGDPFEDEDYIAIVRTILKAVKDKKNLRIFFVGSKGQSCKNIYLPQKIEYSQKDDKLRLLCCNRHRLVTINIARIKTCEIVNDPCINIDGITSEEKFFIVLQIKDERNAMERSMIHFSNFEKVTQQTGDNEYQMKIRYNKCDETEVLIRVLQFGPMIKVMEPQRFINLIKKRLDNQKKLRMD